MKSIHRTLVAAVVGVLGAAFASADVKLPAIFSDNMVLEKSEKTPIFGWADAGSVSAEVATTVEPVRNERRERVLGMAISIRSRVGCV